MSKRKRPDGRPPPGFLTENEKTLLDVIKSSKDMGIWIRDIKYRTNIPDKMVTNSLKVLMGKKLIKEVVTVQNKAKKHYMAAEFEPSKQITGGAWYFEGSLDKEMISILKTQCCKFINKLKVATVEMVSEAMRRSEAFQEEYSLEQVEELVRSLVLDNEVVEVKSTGLGEFASVPAGIICYRCKNKKDGMETGGSMASIPCGVCPRISECTPDGIISPLNCVYFTKWLDF